MEVSKLAVSQAAMKKARKASRREGELRYNRLVEMSESGKLHLATTRQELVQMLGGGQTTLSWVNNMIGRGHLIEQIDKYEDGKVRMLYYLGESKPSYHGEHLANARKAAKKALAEDKAKQAQAEIDRKVQESLANSLVEIKIVRGDVTVTSMLDKESAIMVLGMFMKGE